MAAIHIRNLDDETIECLKRRAKRNNRSLEGEVRHILQFAADEDIEKKRAAFLALSDPYIRKVEGVRQTPSEVLIREDRDRGHRDDY